ncbi:hypothetical protein BS78_01G397900 [Paspalum vaginatum]|nr:hypothetical protein BS78_01G397900 [Paspalum vaginatum]
MQNITEEQSLGAEDNVSSINDAEVRRALEEELGWARLERQKILALSAEADDAIWNLAALARRRMQERDEARNQARMLLADLQARNTQMMMLPGTSSYSRAARPGAFVSAGYRQAAPTALRPRGNTTTMQGQRARTGGGYCVASSSVFCGQMDLASSSLDAYVVQPSLHGITSWSQDHFDPDMFLVDVPESPPQDVVPVPASAGSSQWRSSGTSSCCASWCCRPWAYSLLVPRSVPPSVACEIKFLQDVSCQYLHGRTSQLIGVGVQHPAHGFWILTFKGSG